MQFDAVPRIESYVEKTMNTLGSVKTVVHDDINASMKEWTILMSI